MLGRLTTMESYQFGIELPIDFEVMVFADLEVGGGALLCFFLGRLTTMDIAVIAIRKMFSYMQSELAPYFLKLVCTGLVRLY